VGYWVSKTLATGSAGEVQGHNQYWTNSAHDYAPKPSNDL